MRAAAFFAHTLAATPASAYTPPMPQPPKQPPKPYAPAPGEVASEARRAGFALTKTQAGLLSQYLTLLLKWSRAMNLVGRATWPEVFRDLTADSLHLAEFLATLALPKAPLTLDLGAGAGLPGIPLRVLWPVGDYVLVELREKRAVFLRQAVAELQLAGGLPGVRVVHGRAEAVAPELKLLGLRPRADLIVSRAFMPWPKLLPLATELLSEQGRLVVLSNEPAPSAEALAETGAGFVVEASQDYPAGGKTRYFWSLIPAMA
jgi:16S rRNA (guanine527-N7)-methyltransferase